MQKLSENTRKNLYYALDETIFLCDQLKIQLDNDDNEKMYEFLNDTFYACLTACRVLNFARKAIKLFKKL